MNAVGNKAASNLIWVDIQRDALFSFSRKDFSLVKYPKWNHHTKASHLIHLSNNNITGSITVFHKQSP